MVFQCKTFNLSLNTRMKPTCTDFRKPVTHRVKKDCKLVIKPELILQHGTHPTPLPSQPLLKDLRYKRDFLQSSLCDEFYWREESKRKIKAQGCGLEEDGKSYHILLLGSQQCFIIISLLFPILRYRQSLFSECSNVQIVNFKHMKMLKCLLKEIFLI